MPGVYKKKECPQCGVEHRKRGNFCSTACANSHRPVSDNIRENMRKVAQEYNKTPEGIAQTRLFGVDSDDYYIEIPDIPEADIPDGFDKAERW